MKAFEPPEWDLSKEYRDTIKQQNDYISAERQRCLKAVDDEPEHIKGSWKPLVAEAKANIRKRIEEGIC